MPPASAALCRGRPALSLLRALRTHGSQGGHPCLHAGPSQLLVAPSNGGGGSGGRQYPDPALKDSFVQVVDGEFVLGCNKFPISGFNQ